MNLKVIDWKNHPRFYQVAVICGLRKAQKVSNDEAEKLVKDSLKMYSEYPLATHQFLMETFTWFFLANLFNGYFIQVSDLAGIHLYLDDKSSKKYSEFATAVKKRTMDFLLANKSISDSQYSELAKKPIA